MAEDCVGRTMRRMTVDMFGRLPKRGKPREGQWTVLAGIGVQLPQENISQIKIISLATGTKCLSGEEREKGIVTTTENADGVKHLHGALLNDCHAEVLARRGAILWLMEQMEDLLVTGSNEVVETCFTEGHQAQLKVKQGVKFHFYSSHLPCGDACIPSPSSADLSGRKVENSLTLPADAQQVSDRQLVNGQALLGNIQKSDDNNTRTIKQQRSIDDSSILDERERKRAKVDSSPKISDSKTNSPNDDYTISDTNTINGLITEPLHETQTEFKSKNNADSKLNITTSTESDTMECDKINRRGQQDHVQESASAAKADVPVANLGLAYETGAKCVAGSLVQDPDGSELDAQTGLAVLQCAAGPLRNKPGRGSRTWSLSCSDKILKWTILGFQGSLLAHFLAHPVTFSTIAVTRGNPADHTDDSALERAFWTRFPHGEFGTSERSPQLSKPRVIYLKEDDTAVFPHKFSESKSPASDCCLWVCRSRAKDINQMVEVIVAGSKQGWSKKKLSNPSAWSAVCQRHLATRFANLMRLICDNNGNRQNSFLANGSTVCYSHLKARHSWYSESKSKFKKRMKCWPENRLKLKQINDIFVNIS